VVCEFIYIWENDVCAPSVGCRCAALDLPKKLEDGKDVSGREGVVVVRANAAPHKA
jgi:hypothetical protein